MWTYEQATGRLINPSGELAGRGYSGAPSGKNDPDKQGIANVGPLPRGTYAIEAPFDTAEHGPFCLRLAPLASNEMFGRAGFLMHGDSIKHPGAASEGCIVMSRAIREYVWISGDHSIEVVEGAAQ